MTTTPAITRATEEMRTRFGAAWMTPDDARATVSAALTDPTDPGWLAKTFREHSKVRTERFGMEPDGWYCEGCGARVADRYSPGPLMLSEVVSEHVRAWLLGEEVTDRG